MGLGLKSNPVRPNYLNLLITLCLLANNFGIGWQINDNSIANFDLVSYSCQQMVFAARKKTSNIKAENLCMCWQLKTSTHTRDS